MMRDDMSITDTLSEIDGEVEKNILRYGPMDEDLRFLMHVNNMRLVLISGIMSDRRDEVKEFLRGCTGDELEELRGSIQDCVEKEVSNGVDEGYIGASGELLSFLDGSL